MTEFGVDKVSFLKNENGNYEMWFSGKDFSVCFFFKEDYVGVFNPSQSIIKTVRLSQHSVSHDYIVTQGTSGIWFYRKWNSGLAEFWGGKQVSGVGSVNVPAVDFPFALVSLLYKSASAIYSSGPKGVYILSGSGASASLVNTGVYKVSQDVRDDSATTVASIEYNIKGLWKNNQ